MDFRTKTIIFFIFQLCTVIPENLLTRLSKVDHKFFSLFFLTASLLDFQVNFQVHFGPSVNRPNISRV